MMSIPAPDPASLSNVIENPKTRKHVYNYFALANLAWGALAVALLVYGINPLFLIAGFAVLNYLATPMSLLASANVPSSAPVQVADGQLKDPYAGVPAEITGE
jgi:hypothetical protein